MFCIHCGKDIIDGGVCDCQFSISQPDERLQYSNVQQNNYQPQISQYRSQQPQQPPQYNNPAQQYNYPTQQLNYQPQPYYPMYYNPTIIRPPSNRNGRATTGFVFSMIGLIPVLGFVFAIIGLIFSIRGITASGSRNGKGRGLAISGLIVSLINLMLYVLYALLIISANL